MKDMIKPLEWKDSQLFLIDQRLLPHKEEFVVVSNLEQCHAAIKDMVVRGAPLIGFSALWGLCLWWRNHTTASLTDWKRAVDYIITARPTAVNLEYEARRAEELVELALNEGKGHGQIVHELESFAVEQMDKLHQNNLAMAKIAAEDLKKRYGVRPYRLATLCNTGALACGPMGTALGVITHLAEQGLVDHVFASETRPYLQGGRLTAYELASQGINHSLFVEGASSHLLKHERVDAIFIGADRIVRNGDTANKIGSSSLAIVAKRYNIPFYVVAPISSFDTTKADGGEIEIELRPEEEVLSCLGSRIAPLSSRAFNPSFDVTAAEDIAGIICENGLISPVSENNLMKVHG
jgi:methylthioribose-1-phosphate isomerase